MYRYFGLSVPSPFYTLTQPSRLKQIPTSMYSALWYISGTISRSFPREIFSVFLPGTLVTIHHYKIPLCQFILLPLLSHCPTTCHSTCPFVLTFAAGLARVLNSLMVEFRCYFLRQNKAPAAYRLSFVAVFLPTATQGWSRCLWSNFLQALQAWKGFVCWRRRKYGTERKTY